MDIFASRASRMNDAGLDDGGAQRIKLPRIHVGGLSEAAALYEDGDCDMPSTREELLAFLADLGIETSTVDHEPVFTVAESAGLHERIAGGHTKNLFVKDKKGRLFLVVLLHDAEVDLKTIHQKIGAQGRVSFGKAELLMETLGVEPGSVTPFALINDRDAHRVTPVFDEAMMREPLLNYHPLRNNATTAISNEGLMKFARACGHDPLVIAVANSQS